MIHHIRKAILNALATKDSLRYGELKPKDLDGNVFNYHLKGLIADHYVHKDDAGDYSLTRFGRDYIVHRYEDPAEAAHSIFLIVLQRNDEYMLRRRDVQPLIGYTGFIHGEPEPGRDIIQTARTRLLQKTGIKQADLSVAGTALISQYRNDELQSFSHAVIIYGQTQEDITLERDDTGHNFWGKLETVGSLLPSCPDIVRMIAHNITWLEQTYVLN